MDVRPRLARWALARPHVLIVDAPGSRGLRWKLEEELDRRRWPVARSPADADVLLVVGGPGPELSAAIDVLWSQLPRPRHRREVRDGDVAEQLDAAAAALLERTAHTGEGDDDPAAMLAGQGDDDGDHGAHERHGHDEHAEHGGHEEHDGGRDEHAGHDEHAEHGGHDDHAGGRDEHAGHGDHGGGHDHMHHGGEVAGLPMAGTAPDRDGLELDALAVSLGPLLPGWPTGLVLSASLQGDVLTGVQVSWLDADHVASAGSRDAAPSAGADDHHPGADVGALDSLGRFLVVAGWPLAARRARAARHHLLSDDEGRVRRGRAEASRLARSVRRSPFLRWSLRGLGPLPGESGLQAGDVLDRVYRWCDHADGTSTPPAAPLLDPDALAGLVEGRELASARLIVASVDVDRVGATAGHGSAHA